MGTVFFHVDMDAFFASIEQYDHPEYRGKPLIVGLPEKRSVVSTCSYEARKFGVHSAMPGLTAKNLCPNGIFVPPNMKRYTQVSRQIMEIFSSFSPCVQQISVDEAFLDMTGTQRLFGEPRQAARLIKAEVKRQTGLTISIGIAQSRYLAKLASDYRKPDGLCAVSPGKEIVFIDAVGLKKMWGLGPKGLESLMSKGISTTKDLREKTMEDLVRLFGSTQGPWLYKIARGIDPGIFTGEAKSRSISTETTFYDDETDPDSLCCILLQFSQELMYRAFDDHVIPRTVVLKIRSNDFSTTTVQTSPDYTISSAKDVYACAKGLLAQRWKKGEPVRLIGLCLKGLVDESQASPMNLFDQVDERQMKIEKAINALNKKGLGIKPASTLHKD